MEETVAAALQDVDVPRLVSTVLEATMAKAAALPTQEQVVTPFHASEDPHIPVSAYIQRMERYGHPSSGAFLHAVVLMDRITTALPKGFSLSPFCVHRLLGISVMLASKMIDDVFLSNLHWCRVLGISLRELNIIEVAALKLLRWRVHVDVPQFLDYLQALVSRADSIMMSQQQQTQPQQLPAPSPSTTRATPKAAVRPTSPPLKTSSAVSPPIIHNNQYYVSIKSVASPLDGFRASSSIEDDSRSSATEDSGDTLGPFSSPTSPFLASVPPPTEEDMPASKRVVAAFEHLRATTFAAVFG